MNLRVFLLCAISYMAAVCAQNKIPHHAVQPFPQPLPALESEKLAIKHKPQIVIAYGCDPYPAVAANGDYSGGLKFSGDHDGECKGSGLGSQIYARSCLHKDKWATMYTWYLPKGKQPDDFGIGHRHSWLYVVVWTDSPNPDHSVILGVSAHTGLTCYKNSHVDPKYVFNGNSVKFEAYPTSNDETTLRLTTLPGKNQDLIMWDQLTEAARVSLNGTVFEGSHLNNVLAPIRNEVFKKNIADLYPF